MMTLSRPVWARATARAQLVTSEPFLAKTTQSRGGRDGYQELGQLHPLLRREVLAVGPGLLGAGRLLHLGVAVPQDDGPVGAHEVDVLVAVDVPDAAALAAGQELGVGARGEQGGVHVAVDPRGDDLAGAGHELFAAGEGVEMGFGHGNPPWKRILLASEPYADLKTVSIRPGGGCS